MCQCAFVQVVVCTDKRIYVDTHAHNARARVRNTVNGMSESEVVKRFTLGATSIEYSLNSYTFVRMAIGGDNWIDHDILGDRTEKLVWGRQ